MKTLNKFSSLLVAASVMVGSLGFTACSDDDDDFAAGNRDGVVLTYFGTMPATRGQEIQIHGRNLNNVKAVVFPITEEVSDFTLVNNENISVTVPEEALAGYLRLVTVSNDTVVSKSLLSYEEEITVSRVTPTQGLMPGDIITVTGECVYNIASITFADGVEVPSTDFVSASRRELKVRVPDKARSGAISFSDGNADEPWDYTYTEPLDIVIPSVTSLDKTRYDFCEPMVVTGENLQLVEKVIFPGDVEVTSDELTVSTDGTSLTFEIPDECADGKAQLVLSSGVTIETPEFKLPIIDITDVLVDGVSVGRDENNEIKAAEDLEPGMELRIVGENLNRVKRIFLPGVTNEKYTNYIFEDNKDLLLYIPAEGMNDGVITLYQNEAVSKYVSASMLVELPYIWMGQVALGSWAGNLYPATWDASLWKKFILREGAVNKPGLMTIYFDHDDTVSGDHILKLVYGDWNTAWQKVSPIDAESGGVIIDPSSTNFKVDITQDDIDKFISDGSFVIYGCGLTLKAIKYEPGKSVDGGDTPPSSEPVEIWSGNCNLSWDTNGRINIPAEHFEGVTAGTVLRIKFNCTENVWCQAQINDGKWGNSWTWTATNFPEDLFNDGTPITSYSCVGTWIPSDMFGWNNFANYHEADFILTQENLDQILANRSDNSEDNAIDSGIIIQGQDMTITNVYLVP